MTTFVLPGFAILLGDRRQNAESSPGRRSTIVWRRGETIRDVYALTVPPDAVGGKMGLDVVLYDTYSLEVIPFREAGEVLTLAPVVVQGGS